MQCTTIKGYDGNIPIMGPKVKFKTLEKANIKLAKINKDPKNHIKRVVYQCEECGFYHIGKSLEMLNRKIPKRKRFLVTGMKLVGQVDLAPFKRLTIEEKKEIKRKKHEEYKTNLAKIEQERRELRDKQRAIMKEENTMVATSRGIKSGKICGSVLTKSFGFWKYYVKLKIVKIITSNGEVRHLKLLKVWPKHIVEEYQLTGNVHRRYRSSMLAYIVRNELKLNK